MKFKDLLTNPSGPGSAQVGARYLIIRQYNEKAIDLINKKLLKEPDVYKDGTGYVIHFRIPSEKYDITFDTVLQLTRPDDMEETRVNNLGEYNVKIFSNIPQFGFIYAYVANDNDLLIDELKSKFDQIFFTKPPVIKNPQKVYGFEKAITLSAIYLERNNLKFKRNMDQLAKDPIDWNTLQQLIPTFKKKLDQYNGKKKEQIDANKLAKKNAAKANQSTQKAQQISSISGQRNKTSSGKVQVQVKKSNMKPLLKNNSQTAKKSNMVKILRNKGK